MRYLNESDLIRLVPDRDYCGLVEQAFQDYGRQGNVTSDPSIATVAPPGNPESMLSMKGTASKSLGLHGVFFGVRSRDYYLAVSDLKTGTLVGVLESSLSYKKRTAASAVVAARFLARPDARRAAVIGSGGIATEVVRQLAMHFRLADLRVASRTAQGARAFVERLQPQIDCPLAAADSVEAAVVDADIVVTITSANVPFIRAGMLKRGSFLCSLGGAHEVDFGVLQDVDRLVVDDIGYALWRGDFKGWVDSGRVSRTALEQRIAGHMGQVALGQVRPLQGKETVMAVVQGMAIGDLFVAKAALDRAELAGAGTSVPVSSQVMR